MAGRGARGPSVGRPFDECQSCGRFVARAGFHEWDLMSVGMRLRCLTGVVVTALGLGLPLAILAPLVARTMDRELDTQNVLVILALGIAIAGAWQVSRLSQAVRRSRFRMSDPMYRARLMEFELQHVGS